MYLLDSTFTRQPAQLAMARSTEVRYHVFQFQGEALFSQQHTKYEMLFDRSYISQVVS